MMNDTKISKDGTILLVIIILLCALVVGSTIYGFIRLGQANYQKEFRK